jgi:hypothetical protein
MVTQNDCEKMSSSSQAIAHIPISIPFLYNLHTIGTYQAPISIAPPTFANTHFFHLILKGSLDRQSAEQMSPLDKIM